MNHVQQNKISDPNARLDKKKIYQKSVNSSEGYPQKPITHPKCQIPIKVKLSLTTLKHEKRQEITLSLSGEESETARERE